MPKVIILGAGISGLSAGIKTGLEVFEKEEIAGGLCKSYYINSEGRTTLPRKKAYRFELGGGHWIHWKDDHLLNFLSSFSSLNIYERKSAVYFSDEDLYIPYPLQNNLSYLPKEISKKVMDEIALQKKEKPLTTFADWLEVNFGKTLCELFFFPFHELYTAGLYKKTALSDQYKTFVDEQLMIKGLSEKTPDVGYNKFFAYPQKGFDDLINNLSRNCKINYNKNVLKIDVKTKELFFEDGTGTKYEKLISTLPLNKILQITGIRLDNFSLPYTSVLVINLAAKRAKKCPKYHWLYIPRSQTGFYRVGFYSNVDSSFLPSNREEKDETVSLYVEKAFIAGKKLKDEEINLTKDKIIEELKNWKFITEPKIVSLQWIEIAYCWQFPESRYKKTAIDILRKHGIYQIGRYGRWENQGISESIRDGLELNEISS
jgi:protoporphyrinogen oxidase